MTMGGTLELVDLEEMLTGGLRCESQHLDHNEQPYGPCTVEVVARWGATCKGGRSLLVCETVRAYAERIMALPRKCGPCQRPTEVCWYLNPV
jgi:hypothetical protein